MATIKANDVDSSITDTHPRGPLRAPNGSSDEEVDVALLPTTEFDIEETAPTEKPAQTWSLIFSRGVQLYCLAMLCGSLMKATSKMLVERLNPFIVVLIRMSITSGISMSVMHWKKVDHYFWGQPGIRLLLFIRGGLGFFNICCTYYAIQYLTLPDLAVISFLTPLTTSVAARVFLGEQYRWQQALASMVSLLGVVVIARPTWIFGSHAGVVIPPDQKERLTPGELQQMAANRTFAIISSLFVVLTATAVMVILRKIRDRAHALASVGNYAVVSVFGSLIALAFLPSTVWDLPRTAKMWALMLAMGVFGFLLQYLSSYAIQLEEATVLANFKYTQLLYATTLEFLFWHDTPDWISVLGMALVLGGVIWSARYKAKHSKS